jgi:hypothetical protein
VASGAKLREPYLARILKCATKAGPTKEHS